MADAWRRLRVAGLLLLAVLAAATLVWALACRRLQEGADQSAAANGWSLAAGPARWSGWPLAAAVTFPDAILRARPGTLPPLVWTVPRLSLRLGALSPTHLTVLLTGAQTVASGSGRPLPFTAADLVATVDLRTGAAPEFTVRGLTVDAPGLPIRVDAGALRLRADGWSADLAGVGAGETAVPGASLTIEGHIAPAIEPLSTATETAQAWRARGGRVALRLTDVRWGSLAADAAGTLTLDPALQPAFDGTITAAGLPEALGQLAAAGLINPAAESAARAMLVILAAPAGGGPVTLPIALRSGLVTVARIPLLRLAPVQWD